MNEPFRGDEQDLFAAAVVLFYMRTGKSPFTDTSSKKYIYAFA
jgi:hypothetical protein